MEPESYGMMSGWRAKPVPCGSMPTASETLLSKSPERNSSKGLLLMAVFVTLVPPNVHPDVLPFFATSKDFVKSSTQ
jgi:hypothetical protein